MKRLSIPLLLPLIFCLINIPALAEQTSFTDALRIMLDSNEELHSAKAEVDSKRYERRAAYGLFFPQVSISTMYTHINDDITLDISPIREAMIALHTPTTVPAGVPYTLEQYQAIVQQTLRTNLNSGGNWQEMMQKQDFWSLSASLKWPVWTGGKIIAANNAAEARVEEASEKYRYTRGKLTTELVERYFGYRLSLKVVEVRKEVLDGMDKHLNEAVALEKSGMIAQAERLHAEVARSDADREYKKASRDADIALTGLRNTLALSYNLMPATPLFILAKLDDLDYFRKTALAHNPVLLQVAANRDLAHQAYMKELSRYSPDVFLFGNKELASKNRSLTTPEWYVGAGATMILFEGGNGYHSLKAADSMEERVSLMERKVKSDIAALVEKCYNEMMKNKEQLESLDSSLSFAKEYLRVRDKAFQEGLATSTDLVDAQLNLSKVKIERLKALYDFDVSLARLLEVCGISEQIDAYRNQGTSEVEF